MKCLKKVLVSALISASLCSNITKAIPAAGWAGIVTAGLAVVGGSAAGIGYACSKKNGEEKNSEKESSEEKTLYAADPGQPPVTDEQKGQILLDFFGKYCKKTGLKIWDVQVGEKIKDEAVEVKFWDVKSQEYKTVKNDEAKDVVGSNLGMFGIVYGFLSSTDIEKKRISYGSFNYGLSFGGSLYGSYEVFVSDNCKFIKAAKTSDGFQDDRRYCVTLKID